MSENTELGILVRCAVWQYDEVEVEYPECISRAGAVLGARNTIFRGRRRLGRFRSLIPCACHATGSQNTVNTTVNPQRAFCLRILRRSA